jgi:predicted protein tyrosine phosphatase
MDLWSNIRSRIDAMDKNTSPATSRPTALNLKNKVVHADLTNITIDDASTSDGAATPTSSQLVEQNSAAPEDVANQKRAAEMQMWWEKAYAKNIDLPDGYQNVAVLLIKWEDELDELNTREEASNPPTPIMGHANTSHSAKNSRLSSTTASTMSPRSWSSMSPASLSTR